MSKLLVLFIAGFIGLLLRYIILGKFEMDQLLLLLLFPVASVLILLIMKWQYKKDHDFQPKGSGENMVTRLSDRVSTTPKQMYIGNVQIGTYQRFYNKWWQRIVADVMDTPGQWYLNLSFTFSNGNQVLFKGKRENKIHGNNEWVICQNSGQIGTIRTDYTMKNAAKLKESLYLEIGENTYHYQSFGIGSKTVIYCNDSSVATGWRTKGSEYAFAANSSCNEDLHLLFMVYILFNYQFGQ